MPTSALINIYMYAYACIYTIIAITIIILSGLVKDKKPIRLMAVQ